MRSLQKQIPRAVVGPPGGQAKWRVAQCSPLQATDPPLVGHWVVTRRDWNRRIGAGSGCEGPWRVPPSSLVPVAADRARASFEPDLTEDPSPAATWMASPISPVPVKAASLIRGPRSGPPSGAAHTVPAVQALVAGATANGHRAAHIARWRILLTF